MPFKKGESGNPAGRQAGTRNRITEAFLRDLEEHWRKYGKDTLKAAMVENPAAFVATVSKLLPKEMTLEVKHSFVDTLRELERIRREGFGAVGAGVAEEREQPASLRH